MADPADGRGLAEWAEQVGASERTLARSSSPSWTPALVHGASSCVWPGPWTEISRGLPVAQVAATVGYASQAAFSAMFSRALGVPPSRFGGR
jgi:AraC-like DNA-binding protein